MTPLAYNRIFRRSVDHSKHDKEIDLANATKVITSTTRPFFDENVKKLVLREKCKEDFAGFCYHGDCTMLWTLKSAGGKDIPFGPFCECEPRWMGDRCQYMQSLAIFGKNRESDSAARTVGLSFVGVILLAAIGLVIFAYRKNKPSTDSSSFASANSKRQSLRRMRRVYPCKSYDVVDGSRLQQEEYHVEDLTTVCRFQQPPKDSFRTTASPWSQASFGSPVSSPVVVHWSPRGAKSIASTNAHSLISSVSAV